MKAGQGKLKGGEFERKMCESLSRWLSDGKRKDLLCRTVSSGGQFTRSRKTDQYIGLAGDIRSQDPMAYAFCEKFVIECKFWEKLHLQDFFLGSGELFKAIKKVEDEGIVTNKQWLLIAKENYKSEIIFMSSLVFPVSTVPYHPFNIIGHNSFITFARLDEFLKLVAPGHLVPNPTLESNLIPK